MERIWHRAIWAMAMLMLGCGAKNDTAPAGIPGGTQECTLVGCDSGAFYMGSFALKNTDPTTLQVTRCINGSCETAPVQATAPLAFSCSTATRLWCNLGVSADGTTGVLWLNFLPPAGADPLTSLQDGDQYVVSLARPGQLPVVTLSATAGYRTSKPNGPNCAPTCKQVQLTPSG
jgi:hypothetical protein